MAIALSGRFFLPTTIKSHMVKIVITWSISPDENNNIGLVYIKKSDIKNRNFLFLFNGLKFDILEKRKKIGGHQTNYLSGGPNLTPPPQNIGQTICTFTESAIFVQVYAI